MATPVRPMPPKIDQNEAMEMAYAQRFQTVIAASGEKFLEIPSSLFIGKLDLKMGPLPEVAIYIKNEKTGKIELLRKATQPFSPLALSSYEVIYIPETDRDTLRLYAERYLLNETTGGTIKNQSVDKRMDSLRKAAILVVEDLFINPSPENIKKSTKVVGSFVSLLMRDPGAYLHLAKLSSHDPYTLQHSVGAAVNSVILGRKTGIKDEQELVELGMGGLLHDIGKIKINPKIINKEGPLDPQEWQEMRQHSSLGLELIAENPDLTERTKRAVVEHHEDKSGTGYPSGMKWDQVAIHSKIVCLSDIYNALTTNRSYSKARTPFEAFQLIREKLYHKIDEELFKNLVLIYGGKIEDL